MQSLGISGSLQVVEKKVHCCQYGCGRVHLVQPIRWDILSSIIDRQISRPLFSSALVGK